MPINKVVFGGSTLMDISDSNVTPETLQKGVVAYNSAGEQIVGTMSKFNEVYPVSSTDGVAYTATVDGLDELYAGLRITVIPDRVSSTKTPTLDINGTGAKNIIIPIDGVNGVITTNAAELPTWFSANHPMEIMYDGTRWRSEIKAQSAQYMYGKVPLADINSSTSDAGKTLQVGTDGVPAWTEQPIKYVESLDQNNMVNLRDLESGSYILHGYFHPYAGATNTLTFSSNLLVGIVTKTAGTHVQIFYPVNNVVQFLEIMVDSTQATGYTYKRTDIKLSELVTSTALNTELAKYLPLAGGEKMTGALDMGGNEIGDVSNLVALQLQLMASDRSNGILAYVEGAETDADGNSGLRLGLYGYNGDEPVVIGNLMNPVEDTDAANKAYVLSAIQAAFDAIPSAEGVTFGG